jgi:ribose 5-phosphate isomerase B
MAANKIRGARCALCHDAQTVLNAREHNDANILALGERLTPFDAARRMVNLFLDTPFAGGRHQRRVDKISAMDPQS